MNSTRAIAIGALALALALAAGAITPERQSANASPIILIATPQADRPTPALPTPALAQVEPPAQVEQLAPAEVPQLAQVEPPAQVEQPQVEQPQVEQPQVEQPQVEQLAPLEVLHCPCNVLENEPPAVITDRQRQQSAARTR